MKNAAAAKAARPDLAKALAHALDPCRWAWDELAWVADSWQAKMMRSSSSRVLLLCARQSGKSTACATMAVWEAVFRPGSVTLLVSPTMRQSSLLYKKCADIFRRMRNPPAFLTDNLSSCTLVGVGNEPGSQIISLPGDSTSIRGYTATTVIVDECAYVPDDLVTATLLPMVATNAGKMILMGTPASRSGIFYRSWMDTRTPWERTMVPASECPRIPAEYLEEQRAMVSDDIYAAEFECQWRSGASSIFSGRHLEAAIIDRPDFPLSLVNIVRSNWSGPVPEAQSEPEMLGEPSHHICALDVGQARDFSAFVVGEVRKEVERQPDVLAAWEGRTGWDARLAAMRQKVTTHVHIVAAARFILGTPYPDVIADIERLMQLLEIEGSGPASQLWLDSSGVGRGIADAFEDRDLRPNGITITGGNEVTIHSRRDQRIPKSRLIGNLSLMLQQGRLKVSDKIPALSTWLGEMESFTAKVSAAGAETMEGLGSVHDDLVIASAICCWGAAGAPARSGNRFI